MGKPIMPSDERKGRTDPEEVLEGVNGQIREDCARDWDKYLICYGYSDMCCLCIHSRVKIGFITHFIFVFTTGALCYSYDSNCPPQISPCLRGKITRLLPCLGVLEVGLLFQGGALCLP